MYITSENIILIGSFLLLISIVAGKTTYKFGVPTLLLFLTIGMLSGSDGLIGITFDDPKLAQLIGIVSLNFILFSGGLDTSWKSVKPILRVGIVLSTLGVLLTAILTGLFVWFITDFTIYESLLFGSIVSSTDAAAVFSILRSKSLSLKANLRPILELESGSNDPIAYVLTIALLSLVVNQNQNISTIILLFLQQMILGTIAGFIFGKLSKLLINNIDLDFEGLYSVLVISLMFMTFSATDFIGGNGFLAIYICAVYLGNQELMHKKSILKIFDGYAWLMQIVLFLTLGLLVYPTNIIPYFGIGMVISLFLILISRPISVLTSLIFFKMKLRIKLYIAWVGLRGAVPIVFATYPLLAGIEKAEIMFNIVFFIAVTSVIIQGSSIPFVAKILNVALPEKVKPISEIDKIISELPKSSLREFIISESFNSVNKKIIDLNFPKSAFIVMIRRNNEYIRPQGGTKIIVNDILMVLADSEEEFTDVLTCLSK